MRQIFFYIPFWHVPVYGYGVMMVVGFITGMYVAQFLARRVKLDPEIFANAAILALVTGVFGARLSHVLENLSTYTNHDLSFGQNLWNAVNIREGGLTYYGGFLFAFPSLVLYGMWRKVPLPLGMDIIAPCLMLGLAFGRIGCFLNGCCYGSECNVAWAVEFPYGSDAYVTQFRYNMLRRPVPRALIRDHSALGEYMDEHGIAEIREPAAVPPYMLLGDSARGEPLKSKEQVVKDGYANLLADQKANAVHPAEIYSSVVAFSICAFLLACFTLPHVPGRLFAAMMMIEGAFRYLLEMLRVEPAVIGHGTKYLRSLPPQSYSMVVSFILVVFGAVLWYVFGRVAGVKQSAVRADPATT